MAYNQSNVIHNYCDHHQEPGHLWDCRYQGVPGCTRVICEMDGNTAVSVSRMSTFKLRSTEIKDTKSLILKKFHP